jgi:tripartite-type tricarboxylate transporter receptor subunit TctC
MIKRLLTLLAGGALLGVLSVPVEAQDYPTNPITIIVPFAAGGHPPGW